MLLKKLTNEWMNEVLAECANANWRLNVWAIERMRGNGLKIYMKMGSEQQEKSTKL